MTGTGPHRPAADGEDPALAELRRRLPPEVVEAVVRRRPELSATRRPTPPTGPLVGRQRECQRLEEAARAALAGRGAALLFCGETGVGKSALALQAAESSGARACRSAC